MSNQPKTPARTFRIPEELIQRLDEVRQAGQTRTDLVVKAIEQFLKSLGGDQQ